MCHNVSSYLHGNVNKLLPPANKVWGKVIFSVACVNNSVQRVGCLPQCMLGYTHPPEQTSREQTPPGSRHPPRADTPPEQMPPLGADTPQSRHPPGNRPPWEQTSPRSRHPPAKHAGRYGQRAGGTHPTGMQSCFLYICVC